MKIVIIGGTGLIGSKTVARLMAQGHEVIAASPNTGVNTVTGEGLAAVLDRADIVIDLANSPSFENEAVMAFFKASGENLMAAEKAAGVRHHIALSVVGTKRLQDSGYFRAKQVQEDIIAASGISFTIVHSTQFFEFVPGIAQSGSLNDQVHVSTALIQPISAEDVADAMAFYALGQPANGIVQIAGPELFHMHLLIGQYLRSVQDGRQVVSSPDTPYFGVVLQSDALVPAQGEARLGHIRFEEWLGHRITAG